MGLIPGLGRSLGEGNGNPLQYSCLENSMDREAWWAAVPGVARVGYNFLTKQQKQVNVARLQLEKKISYFDISFVGVLNMHKKQYIYT